MGLATNGGKVYGASFSMRTTSTRILLLVLYSLAGSPIGFSQCKEEPANEKKLYSLALFASIEKMDKDFGYLHQTNYHHLTVQKDPAITDALPTKQGDYNVEYLDDREILVRRKNMRKNFATFKIFPMWIDKSSLRISIRVEWAELEKGKLMLAISDWSDGTFRFDCEKKEFVISDIKLGGI